MKPKKLSIREIWELYRLLGSSQNKKYLIDEVVYILKSVPHKNIMKSLEIMYGVPKFSDPLQYGMLIINGLKANNFFDFREHIGKLNGS